jgi:hypothetical protein
MMFAITPSRTLSHRITDRPAEVDVAEHLEVPRAAPDFIAGRAEVARGIRAGVVDEDVDLGASGREALLILDLREVDRVYADIDDRSGLAQRVARLLQRCNAAPGNIEVAAFRRERMRDRETDPLAGAGNERALPFQSQVHRQSSLRRAYSGASRHQIRRASDDQ